MRTHGARFLLGAAAVAAGLMGMTAGTSGQGRAGGAAPAPPPVRVQLQIVQVKPEMQNAFRDLVKAETIPALKKAGVPWVWTFTSFTGQGFTAVVAQPIASYADFDKGNALEKVMGADGLAKYNAKLRPTLVSTRRIVQTLNRNASILGNSQTAPRLVQVQDIQPLPGKQGEFLDLIASEYVPAWKKAGVTETWTYVNNMGGGAAIANVRPLANWAELDQPGLLIRVGMSQEAAQKLNARRNALATVVEQNVLVYQADLSFGVPKTN